MKTNYRVQEPRRECRNCRNGCVLIGYNDQDKTFCMLGAKVRPRCGSVLMGEEIYGPTSQQKWDTWANEHKVDPNGICDDYEEG